MRYELRAQINIRNHDSQNCLWNSF